MGIPRDADENAIKQAFKNLSRKCHPDKNPHPEATLLFQRLNNAHDILSDPDKRAHYDRYGDDAPNGGGGGGTRGGGGGVHFNGHGFGGHEVDPQELFRMFFGGGLPAQFQQRRYQQQHHHHHQQQQQQQQQQQGGVDGFAGMGNLLQLLPLLLFLLMSLGSFDIFGGGSAPPRNFHFSRENCLRASSSNCFHVTTDPSDMFLKNRMGLSAPLQYWVPSDVYRRLNVPRTTLAMQERLGMDREAVETARNVFFNECKAERSRSRFPSMEGPACILLSKHFASIALPTSDVTDM